MMKKVIALVIVVMALLVSASALAKESTKAIVFTMAGPENHIEKMYKVSDLTLIKVFLKPTSIRNARVNLVILNKADVCKFAKLANEVPGCKVEKAKGATKRLKDFAKSEGISKPVYYFTFSVKQANPPTFTDPIKPRMPLKSKYTNPFEQFGNLGGF